MDTLFGEIQHKSRSQQIVHKFREALANGTLSTGDKLPPERDLCVQFGVSRTSLREAVRALEAYGLVESTQGGGTYIADKFSENIFDFLGFGNCLSKKNFAFLLDTRRILETGAVESALDFVSAKDIAVLSRIVDKQEKEKNPEQYGILDAQFHEQIVCMSGNPILAALYKMIYKMLLQGTSRVAVYPGAWKIALRDHRALLEALKMRDRKKCIQTVKKHLKNTELLIEKYLHEGE